MGLENIVNCVKGLVNKEKNVENQLNIDKEGLLKDLKNYAQAGDIENSENFMRSVMPAYGEWMNKIDYKELENEGKNLLQLSYIKGVKKQLALAEKQAYNGSVRGAQEYVDLALNYAKKGNVKTGNIQNILDKAYEKEANVQKDLGRNYGLRKSVSEDQNLHRKDYGSRVNVRH
ncbi:MAG: hypothetical protein ACOCZQ_03235 [Nanoarchaeota archaeon]